MTIVKLELYLSSIFSSAVLLFLSLADIDVLTRIITGAVGALAGILTIIRVIQRLRTGATEDKIRKLDMKMKEEEVRRYFETKYSSK